MITERIITQMCFLIKINENRLTTVIDNVSKIGFVRSQDIKELTSLGLPVVAVAAGVLKVSNKQACGYFLDDSETKVSYQDLLVIIGIIAQDFQLRAQQYLINKYNG